MQAVYWALGTSDISEDPSMHWAREKVRVEKELFALAESTNLSVIAYRPDYIGPTQAQAHLGQILLYWFFAPIRAAVRAQQIGETILEVTARGNEFNNGDKLGTASILHYRNAYRNRRSLAADLAESSDGSKRSHPSST